MSVNVRKNNVIIYYIIEKFGEEVNILSILTEGVNGNIKLSFGEETANYTVSRLNPDADADSLLLLAEAVSILQGITPLDLVSKSEYRLIPE